MIWYLRYQVVSCCCVEALFSFKLIYQLLKLTNEKICFKTGKMLQNYKVLLRRYDQRVVEETPQSTYIKDSLRFDFCKTSKFRRYYLTMLARSSKYSLGGQVLFCPGALLLQKIFALGQGF